MLKGIAKRCPGGMGRAGRSPYARFVFFGAAPSVGGGGSWCAVRRTHIFAHLDDIHIVSKPGRVADINVPMRGALWRRARIMVHRGKKKVWYSSGDVPANLDVVVRGDVGRRLTLRMRSGHHGGRLKSPICPHHHVYDLIEWGDWAVDWLGPKCQHVEYGKELDDYIVAKPWGQLALAFTIAAEDCFGDLPTTPFKQLARHQGAPAPASGKRIDLLKALIKVANPMLSDDELVQILSRRCWIDNALQATFNKEEDLAGAFDEKEVHDFKKEGGGPCKDEDVEHQSYVE